MKNETVSLEFQLFRDPSGNPTCCSNYPKGEKCRFLQTMHFGQEFGCGYLDFEKLFENKNDFLSPTKNCPVWEKFIKMEKKINKEKINGP